MEAEEEEEREKKDEKEVVVVNYDDGDMTATSSRSPPIQVPHQLVNEIR